MLCALFAALRPTAAGLSAPPLVNRSCRDAFDRKEEAGLTHEEALKLNRAEFEHYKLMLERTHICHQITGTQEQEDGSILVRVRKQYNAKADVDEYFL